ncbi:serine/threonine-protein kinase UCNL-like [Phragmites australis]|uniref:serine/threonine-protein kinase UCNL-like n=1 Tax=Phragmites australis TaxID=29695 RepID=UPI002D79218D|nr:serine/threonine-protein kinase UCNL-like [Phragmites australis]
MDIDLDRARALRVLGRGAMGTVFLVADDHPSASLPGRYALKVFDKRSAKPDADRRARWEVSVLSRLAHPHLPSLLGCAETDDLLAWAVPYCPGGDLNELRYTLPDRVFSPAAIRFYIAETVSALADLHADGVVYRDLKPENVLLRADGHVTLTDFDLSRLLPPRPAAASTSPSLPPLPVFRGHNRRTSVSARSDSVVGQAKSKPHEALWSAAASPRQHLQNLVRFLMGSDGAGLAKKAKSARVSPVSRKPASFVCSGTAGSWGKSYSFVGTEEYVAPEMVRGEGHGFAVDWWAVGVLVYEMAYGRTPFKGQNRKETFRNVLQKEVEFPGDSRRRMPELTDLISQLLEREPRRRLGYAGGADEIRAHPFFAGVAWDMLTELSRPPYIPPPADDVAAGEGFDVRDHFKRLHQSPPKETETDASPEVLTEF